MKRFVYIIPMSVFVVLVLWLMQTQEQKQINPEATMLQTEELTIPDSFESILAEATFYVKARFIEETPYLEGTSYQYAYELIDDYGDNLRPQNGTCFYVYSMMSGLYEPGEVYYLFLQGFEAYMADTIMYTFVCDAFIAHLEDGVIYTGEEDSFEKGTLEGKLHQYALREAVVERTANTFVSDEYITLEDNVVAADAIWRITILSKQDMNPNSSLCEYRIEQVFCGNAETAPEGSVFSGLYPSAQVEVACSYYVILKDEGNFEYEPFTFEHWLIVDGSEESAMLLDLIGAQRVD